MVEPITINIRHLSQDVRLPQEQVQSAIDLLDAGFPVPFIARYRKDVTKDLNEETLRHIEDELRSARVLCERKQAILKTIESAGKLTTDLDKSIREAKSVKRLEDIYLPFKPKRQNSTAARENGLEPFALEILEGKLSFDKMDERASEFINEDKKVKSVADVLLGTGYIIADMFGCNAELVHKVRELLYQHGHLTATKIGGVPVADSRQQTAEAETATEDDGVETVENSEPVAELNEPETPPEHIDETEADTIIDTEIVSDVENSEVSQEESPEELSETSAPLPLSSAEVPQDDSQEVTELFQQLKEAQAEKGLPKVQSQNALKKKKRAEAKKKLDEIKQRQREHFERQFAEYFQFSMRLRGIPAHRILALNRGERHKIIQVAIQIDEAKILESVKEICVPSDHAHAEFLTACLQDALHRGVLPTLIREIQNDMTEYAEKSVIKIFGKNLRNLLLQRPFPHKRVLALESGGKSGYKAVVLDEFGNLLGHETVFFSGNAERRDNTAKILADMIHRFGVSVIALGSRTIEEAIAHMIETHFADSELTYVIVNKSGLTAYSTSTTAKAEFPNEDTFVRGAISIGRRLQDPLNELVKVDPASLGIGMFHHDVRGKYLKQMLADVVESCVNCVGVDLNWATPMLLAHIAGLNPMTARRIYEYRREHGQFRSRDDLKKVLGINETVYTYAAGFLRISGGENPLDSTNIHPESYELAARVLEKLGFSVNELRTSDKVKAVADKVVAEKIGELTLKLSSELNAGFHAVRDILESLSQQGGDPRASSPPLMFRKAALKFENLTPGLELTGTILNVTDFGAFVDIGLHESGFIHVSQMASGYIRDAHEKAAVGDTVRLWVVETDIAKKRVSLTLLPPGTEKQTPAHKSEDKERSRPPRERSARPPRPAGDRRESSEKPRGDQPRPPRDASRNPRDGKRFDRQRSGGKAFERTPKTFVSAPVKKEMKPITEKMKQGKEPMRSFADLAQLFGRVQVGTDEGKDGKK